MPSARTSPPLRRGAALATAVIAISGTMTLAAASGAAAYGPAGAWLRPGDLLVATSVYQNDAGIVAGTTQLPPGCGGSADPCATAVADGDYPYVFNNASADPSFGVTSPITLDEMTQSGRLVGSITVPDGAQSGGAGQMVTSFSSKSELGAQPLDRRQVRHLHGVQRHPRHGRRLEQQHAGRRRPDGRRPGRLLPRGRPARHGRPLPVHRDQRLLRRQRPRRPAERRAGHRPLLHRRKRRNGGQPRSPPPWSPAPAPS